MPLSAVINGHRMASYGLFSMVLVALVVANGFRKHSNFYSIAVYLSRSNGSVLALANFGLLLTLMAGRGLQRIFFGPLRPVETERLYDRMWFFVTESLLAFTIFRDEFDTPFVVMFVVLLLLKCFHWILADRIDWMDQVPYPGPGVVFHVRTISLLWVLWIADLLLTALAMESLLSHGVGWIILFASEYGILLASLMNAWLKYIIAAYDLRRASSMGGENAPVWEDRSMYIFYVELLTDFFKLTIYLIFFGAVMTFYGLPLNVIRDVYITARSFVTRVQDLIRYRTATKNMDQKYPDATPEELPATSDRTCIICREEMIPAVPGAPPRPTNAPNDTPKKLPCGHIFHFHCLRSWLERQQSCPTCRRSVLETAPVAPNANVPVLPALGPGAAAGAVGGAALLPGPAAGAANRVNPQGGAEGHGYADQIERENAALLAETDALLERLGFRNPPDGARAGPSATPATGAGTGSAPQNTPQPRTFQGFSAGGVWQQWNQGSQQRQSPSPPPTLQPTPTIPLPSIVASGPSENAAAGSSIAPSTSVTTHQQASAETSMTPREAAAAAALRRLGGGATPSSSSNTTPSSTPFRISTPTSEKSLPTAPTPLSTSTPQLLIPSATPRIAAPALIPLFDPSAISTQLTQRLPSPHIFTTPFAGFPFLSPPPVVSTNPLQIADRTSLEERLRVLEDVQVSLRKCLEDLATVSATVKTRDVRDKGKDREIT